MADIQQMSMSAIRIKMVATSLIIAGVVGLVLLAVGYGVQVFIGTVFTALLVSLFCSAFIRKTIAGIRADQLLAIASLQLREEESSTPVEQDDIKGISSSNAVIIKTVEKRRAERTQLLEQIEAAEEQLKLIITSLMSGDDKEVAQVRDAATAMENMNNAFSTVIGELEELSSRTDERASSSAQMCATTDAIAENINQYSTFVIETSRSIEEMTQAMRETAENIGGLSVSTEQTFDAINQISNSQVNVRGNAERSAAASENVRNQAQHGLRSMAATILAMQEIVKSSDESFESINRLSRYSVRVGEFLKVIQEVVEKTNLLSLNASIIAAQAGVRGRAFAVVAEEVRSLAHRTSASTKEIEDLVSNIQKETSEVQRSVTQGKDKVNEGVKISAMANKALVEIEKSAEEASGMGASIANEISDQVIGIQRISEAAERNLERVQQITMTTAQQQDGTSLIVINLEQMRELAHRINSSVQEQAQGSRDYLKSVMEDNIRTLELKENTAQQIAVAKEAVDSVRRVEELSSFNAAESRKILEGLNLLTRLIDKYRVGKSADS